MDKAETSKDFSTMVYKTIISQCILFILFFVCSAHAGEITTTLNYNPKEVSINNSGESLLVQLAQCKNIISDENRLFPVQDFFIVLPPSGFVTKITIASHKVVSIPINSQQKINPAKKPMNKSKLIEYLGEQWVNGKNMGVIRVYPLQYDDSKENLLLSTDLKFKIRYRTTRRRII